MKKLIALVLALVLCFSLCACEKEGDNEDVEDIIKEAVESELHFNIIMQYDTAGYVDVTYNIDETGEDEFEVTGTVSVRDKSGTRYTGNYYATVEYNSRTGKCDVDCDIDTMYRN